MADHDPSDQPDCGGGAGRSAGGGDCTEALHELYGYLDGELTEHKRNSIQAHLDDCSPCVGAYDFEAELRRVIARRCHDTVPQDLRNRIRDLLTAPDQP